MKRKEVTTQNRFIFFRNCGQERIQDSPLLEFKFYGWRSSMDRVNLHEEIFTVARDLYERTGRVEGRDLDNWLEAERIVMTLRRIAGEGGNKYVLINVPAAKDSLKEKKDNTIVMSNRKGGIKRRELNQKKK
jgi:hypothetical protein